MKKILFPLLLILLPGISCKKKGNNAVDNSYTVEYRIDPINSNFVRIAYKDANGNLAEITDFEQMVDGKRSIRVTAKPFNAEITTDVNNTQSNSMYFNLQIWVNGELKGYQAEKAAPNSTSTATLKFTVN